MKKTMLIETQPLFDHLEETGNYVCFEFLGVSIGLYCDDEQFVDWFSKYFGGYFVPSKSKSTDAIIYSTQDARLFHSLSMQATSSEQCDAEHFMDLHAQTTLIYEKEVDKKSGVNETCYLLSQAGKRVLIASPGTLQARRATVKRTIRNMMKLLLMERGWLPLHASACVKDGVGICLLGGNFAGKTSTLLNLLAQPETNLVSNDTLFIRDAGDHLEGCGFPNKAGIRIGTLLANPELLSWIEQTTTSFYPQIDAQTVHTILATTPPAELSKRPEKIVLLPTELAELLHISIEYTASIQLFFVVQFDPTLDASRLVSLDGEQTIAHMAPHFRSLSAEKQPFLQQFFDFDETLLRMKLVSLLTKYASQGSMHLLSQNAGTNAHSNALIEALAGEYAPIDPEKAALSTTGPLSL